MRATKADLEPSATARSARDGEVEAVWQPTEWTWLIANARSRARDALIEAIGGDADALIEHHAREVANEVLVFVKSRVGLVDWRFYYGVGPADTSQTRMRAEAVAFAAERWPDPPLPAGDARVSASACLCEWDAPHSIALRIVAAKRRRFELVVLDWLGKLAFAVGVPEDAFAAVLDRDEEGFALINPPAVMALKLAEARQDALDMRRHFEPLAPR